MDDVITILLDIYILKTADLRKILYCDGLFAMVTALNRSLKIPVHLRIHITAHCIHQVIKHQIRIGQIEAPALHVTLCLPTLLPTLQMCAHLRSRLRYTQHRYPHTTQRYRGRPCLSVSQENRESRLSPRVWDSQTLIINSCAAVASRGER